VSFRARTEKSRIAARYEAGKHWGSSWYFETLLTMFFKNLGKRLVHDAKIASDMYFIGRILLELAQFFSP